MPDPLTLSAADRSVCRRLLRGGSRSFYAASFVLPARVRQSASALYAFCRVADDAIDRADRPEAALAGLHDRLDACYAGEPSPWPEDRALASVVSEYGIPKALLLALLEGFAWDAVGRRYADLSELVAYSTRVAGSVGAMMAALMGARSPELVARACDLGIAMQLTNIARDVGEDARAGRLYLPEHWLREVGVHPDRWLERPVFDARLALVIRRLLREADGFYRRADAGIAGLSLKCRPGIYAARLFYAAIGQELERSGLDSVNRRAVVSGKGKLKLLASLPRALLLERTELERPVQAEASFLVDAVVAAPAGRRQRRSLAEGVVWVLDLFEALDTRHRTEPAPTVNALADERAY